MHPFSLQIPFFNLPFYLFEAFLHILHSFGINIKYNNHSKLPPIPSYIDYRITETYSDILSLLPKPAYDEDSSPSGGTNDNDPLQ